MTGTDRTALPDRRPSLGQRLTAAIPVILANGWAAGPQLERAQAQALQGDRDHLGVGRFLVDLGVLTRDQAMELEEILEHQQYFNDYLLLRKLGSGGMGTVFLAEHGPSGRRVALKTMNARLATDPNFIGRFHREAEALRRVQHPHIAAVYDSGEQDGHCWLAMEYIDGPSLMHLLKDYQVLPEVYALRIVRQVAEGLAHVWNTAHLVHRDLKPENILVIRARSDPGNLFPEDDVAKLIDFGLVKGERSDDRLTQTGMTIGTPLYMSPEQVRGEALDCRSDIYGLAATLFHLLTGATPFTGTSPGTIMSAHLTEPVPDPGERVPALTAATRRLVMTGMAKSADDRYRTFEAFIAAIDAALEEAGARNPGGMRLLRKPLVLPPKLPRRAGEGGTERIARAATERIARPATGRTVRDAGAATTERVARAGGRSAVGHAELPPPPVAATAPPADATPLASLTTPAAPASAPAALEPLPHAPRPPDSASLVPPPAPVPTDRRERSKVYDEDPHRPLSVGIVPWLVLALAIVGLLAYLWLFAW